MFLLGPGGRRFDQALATELAAGDGFALLCGRYEGVDHRVREHLVDGELSVGDVVLSGGEAAACVVIDAVTRLLPGAMGNDTSPLNESFGERGLLEEPQYTRPATFRGWTVPDVLSAATTGRSTDGGTPRRCTARWRTVPTSSNAAAASPQQSNACWKSSRLSRILDRPPPSIQDVP